MDKNNNDLIDTNLNSGQADVSQQDQQKYQKVLDDYSRQIASAEKNKNLTQHKLPPQKTDLVSPITNPPKIAPPLPPPILPSKPTISTSVNPQPIVEKTDKSPLRPVQASSPKISQTDHTKDKPVKNKFDLFKYLFYISVIVFLILLGLLSKDYLALRNASENLPSLATPSPATNTSP